MKKIRTIKNIGLFISTAIFILAVMTGCNMPLLNIDTDAKDIPSGKGSVILSITGAETRTIYPDLSGKTFVAEFRSGGELIETINLTNLAGKAILDPGTYDITIEVKDGTVVIGGAVVSGVIVVEDQATVIDNILITPNAGGASGSINWSIEFPDTTTGAMIYYRKTGETVETSIDLLTGTGFTVSGDVRSGTITGLTPGSYRFRVVLTIDDPDHGVVQTGRSEAVHVYPGLTTVVPLWRFDAGEAVVEPITSVAITVATPVIGEAPNAAASGAGDFTIGNVTWYPVNAVFADGTLYTATVTLTVLPGFTFEGLEWWGIQFNGGFPTIVENTGETITLSQVFTPANAITTAAITIPAPISGQWPPTWISIPGDFSLSSITWYPADSPFQAGVEYTAIVTLHAMGGNAFAGGFTATVNGAAAVISDNTGTNVSVSYKFQPAVVGLAGFAIIPMVPITGETPSDQAASAADGFTIGPVTWDPSPAAFEAGQQYKATVTLTALPGFTFEGTQQWDIQFGSGSPTIEANTGNTITLSNTFTAGNRSTIWSIDLNTIPPLLVGGTPPATVSVPSHENRFTFETISWTPDHAVFEIGQAYTARITLRANHGFTFTGSEGRAEVNNRPATREDNTGATVTLVREFTALEILQSVTDIAFTVTVPPSAGVARSNAGSFSGIGISSTMIVGWEPSHTTFEPYTEYTVIVNVTFSPGFTFCSDQTVMTINGNPATLSWIGGNVITMRYTFPPTGAGDPPLPPPVITVDGTVVSWPEVAGAGGYSVRIGGNQVTGGALGAAAGNFDLGNLTLSPGEHTVTVVALGVAGVSWHSPPSNAVTFTAFPPLSAPQMTRTGPTVSWDEVVGASGYRVFIRGGTWSDPIVISSDFGPAARNVHLFDDFTIPEGSHTVTVVALGVFGVSGNSAPSTGSTFSIARTPPLSITGTTANWWIVQPGGVQFSLRIDGVEVRLLSTTTFNLSELDLPIGDHAITVLAIGDQTNTFDSAVSNTVTFTVVPQPLPAPQNLTLVVPTLSWDPVTGAGGYRIRIEGRTPVLLGSGVTSYNLELLELAGGSHHVHVDALGVAGQSLDSLSDNAIWVGVMNAPVITLSGSTISWDTPSGGNLPGSFSVRANGVEVYNMQRGGIHHLDLATLGLADGFYSITVVSQSESWVTTAIDSRPSNAVAFTIGSGGSFTLNFVEFVDLAEGIPNAGPTFSFLDATGEITLTGLGAFSDVRWLQGANPVPAGTVTVAGATQTLTLDSRIHGNRTGTHFVTVVVTTADGVEYSRVITFTVIR
jgi:hypothetical protein